MPEQKPICSIDLEVVHRALLEALPLEKLALLVDSSSSRSAQLDADRLDRAAHRAPAGVA